VIFQASSRWSNEGVQCATGSPPPFPNGGVLRSIYKGSLLYFVTASFRVGVSSPTQMVDGEGISSRFPTFPKRGKIG
jgi:hypothetical protein